MHGTPALAKCAAMRAPMVPAPSTATLLIRWWPGLAAIFCVCGAALSVPRAWGGLAIATLLISKTPDGDMTRQRKDPYSVEHETSGQAQALQYQRLEACTKLTPEQSARHRPVLEHRLWGKGQTGKTGVHYTE